MSQKKQIKLGAFLPGSGHHVAAWRHPNSQADGGLNFQHYKRLAQTAERGKFDMLFLADGLAVWDQGKGREAFSRSGQFSVHFEPLTLLSALSVVTEHIGLVATASTTYDEPFHLARKFASLDYLSGGRAGWNVVTSSAEAAAKNFSREEHLEHSLRYERAREFLEVTSKLWDSWEDDAFLRDKESGIYFDPDKLHIPNHKGEYFSVRGPLNVARPIQGYPVIVQAGSSEAGQDLAAQTAEAIFTAQQTLAEAQVFYSSVKGRLSKYGRSPDHLKIMPGVFPVIGRTEEEAKEKYQQLQELIHPSVGLGLLSGLIGGHDLSKYPLDGPLPDLPDTNGGKSRLQLITDLARRENLTIRQLYLWIAGARGHRTILGTPEQIADQLEDWFINDGADGFNIMPPWLPGGLDEFVDLVIPELQRRGLFRTEYEGRTLRENLGLPRPVNQFTKVASSELAGALR
ncbi:nitrilotriacetate monooxygenase [Nostoc linckia z18]|uniref:Nitrilotriacetate monooxygenase n=2 Tax=Nostoc linckia TaxID=92942 RepID=A0A9Q5ZEV3_NOSLI|nr:LLM class flavin-dependent oxidoreductase [Nostoc linckia]PHK40104.1 nitrilotriacetate monooxygenase [Nostoc linckia z15]PHK46238.1 nitrilotriacetate monooxygenase [Nostoc linckia z16]PHJ66493.1 nitrilotriacetate monooxygenase [Nostoc linckia z1]PHJ71367.1 nitrilotriacetate monooxygenase [Nostoc linckia z3]PHJ75399.1 nitrilotriacetate monooxygenase [Nostoc linckia z2]